VNSKFTSIIALAICTLVFDAQAITIRGASSCGEWVQETQKRGDGSPDATSSFWLLGYLSASASLKQKDILKGTDSASIFVWVQNYCRANPLDKIPDAANELFEELVKRKGL
jgi:hypothetical protein